jgi:outer membrane biogenesis lipoprotein LolB
MDVRFSIMGSDQAPALESLADWLRGEPDLAGRVRLDAPPPRPGEMGSAVDTLMVAIGSGGVVSVLAASLKVWLAQPRRSDIRLLIQGEQGQKIEIEAKRVGREDIEGLLREALHAERPE